MAKKIQLTLSSNESKALIARAAREHPQVKACLGGRRMLLAGGTTVSAFSEELGWGPLRVSGRIQAGGTRTALHTTQAPHNLLVYKGRAVNVDDNIRGVVRRMNRDDLIVTGANAIDPQGRAALAFAAAGGGSRGDALRDAYLQGVPLLILCGLNKLIPDLGSALAISGREEMDIAMGASVDLVDLYGPILTEIKAFELLFGVEAVAVAGDGIGDGSGARTFVLCGEAAAIADSWHLVCAIKGAALSADADSLPACHGGCSHCGRHAGCAYKRQLLQEGW